MMARDLNITRQSSHLGAVWGQGVRMLCITESLLTSGSMQMPGARRLRAGSG